MSENQVKHLPIGGADVIRVIDEMVFQICQIKEPAILPKTSIWLALF